MNQVNIKSHLKPTFQPRSTKRDLFSFLFNLSPIAFSICQRDCRSTGGRGDASPKRLREKKAQVEGLQAETWFPSKRDNRRCRTKRDYGKKAIGHESACCSEPGGSGSKGPCEAGGPSSWSRQTNQYYADRNR